ncbi:MAG: homocysteine S-methyltransferase family protein [Ignavibacteria bacterium]|jgi:homocysteine S-methyltransferase|nr:homocysteine S-methyltransferase family protein [Ignavibacteria bacterium]MCU7504033.1 homocysteine S-methyltransferase family protein [Ignavibacteria bacterium]MCU7515405.1 homocysteine S-methyltransferase family protein [Ignavibacteria bacterium]
MSFPGINIFSFARRINRPLILDGAIGSLLQMQGLNTDEYLWTSLAGVNNQEMVIRIHKDYIDAGADIITANTFRSNPAAVIKSGLSGISSELLVKRNMDAAKTARGDEPVLIAGSNAPAEDCYEEKRTLSLKELESNHLNHINLLLLNGADFILNETQSHFDEIKIICRYCQKNKIPFVMSLFITNEGRLLSGEKAKDVIGFILRHGPLAVGLNCISPRILDSFLSDFQFSSNWGAYLNCGSGNYKDEVIGCGIDENTYGDIVKKMLPLRPSFIGSCCGSNKGHTKIIRDILNGLS